MSMESAAAFYKRVEKDIELQAKLKEFGTITLAEIQTVIFEKNPEMNDEELEAVVGGSVIGTIGLILFAGPALFLGLAAGIDAV